MRYSIYGINYEKACELMVELDSFGIESNITQGGISVYPYGNVALGLLERLCIKYGTRASQGATPFEEDIMSKKDRIKELPCE